MGEKDTAEEKLEDHNDVFTDIYNVLLFKKDYLQEDFLRSGATRSIYKAEDQYRKQDRDICKYYNGANLTIARLGIENQSSVDEDMPIRIMGYDYAGYRAQIQNKQPRHPVITLVMNYSKEDWNKAKSLKELFHVPDELMKLTSDYKIHVVDIHKLSHNTILKFKSDFKYVAAFIKYGKGYLDIFQEDDTLKYPEEVMDLINAMNGTEFSEATAALKNKAKRGEVIHMCTVVQEIMDAGRQEGERTGELKAKKEVVLGMLEENIAEEKISRICKVSLEFIQEVKAASLKIN